MNAYAGTQRRSSSLPGALTPLLGRVHESAALRQLIVTQGHRLVTLTGPGGIGKTRLALHVATLLLDDFDDQVMYVRLASIRDPALVVPAIGQALGVFSDIANAYVTHVIDALRDQRLLLVLDNFEQVLPAAPELASILVGCPDVQMLVTSQAALGIAGEQLYPLLPLATPAATDMATEEILEAEAVALFVQRARAVNPGLVVDGRAARTIAEICRKLEGLPLAIELAAARTSILSPEALLARLSNRLHVLGGARQDVPDRLRTMRNAVAWSYELLQPVEQALFRRLSVFAGGCSLEAVEAVFVPGQAGQEAFDVLGTLVDRSMIKSLTDAAGEPRFLMLETLRDYGQEQLALLGEEDDARLAHAAFFVALAEAAEPHLPAREQQMWLERLDPETENARAAVAWATAHGRHDLTLRLCGATWRYWSLRGRASECRTWLERALVEAPDAPAADRARALIALGHLTEEMRELDAARRFFGEARAFGLATGDLITASRGEHGLGLVDHDSGAYAEATVHHTEAVRLAREAGDARSLANALGSMGAVNYYRGDLEAAERSWEEALATFTALGDTTTEALIASNLGAVAMERGDVVKAEVLHQRALTTQRKLSLARDLPYTLINLGEVYRKLGDRTLSHDCFAEAIQMLREQGNSAVEGVAMHNFARLMLEEGDLPGAAMAALEATRLIAAASDQLGVIECGELVAVLSVAHGDAGAGAELLGAASALRAQLGSLPHPVAAEELRVTEAKARQAMDAEAFAVRWAAGAALPHDAFTRRIGIAAREIVGRQQASPVPARPSPAPPATSQEAARSGAVEHPLTPREVEVLRLLAKGHSTREVADVLYISPRTAGTHVNNILGKLGVPSRTAAVAWALRTGIV